MEKELARHVVRTAFRSASMLTKLVPLINEHCEKGEQQLKLKKALATIIADIGLDINEELFKLYPELKDEIEQSINKYGFLIQ